MAEPGPIDRSPSASSASPPPADGEASVTHGFLFADLRDYTGYVEARGDRAGAALLGRYRALVREAVASSHGAEIRTEGDSFYVVFSSASAAVRCGLAIVAAAATAADPAPIRVGVGVHAGETVETAEGFVGSAVNLAARLCAEAKAGEVVVSDTVRGLTRTSLEVAFEPLGLRRLKGIADPVACYRVVPQGQARTRPAGAAWARSSRGLWVAAGAGVLLLATLGYAAMAGRAPATPSPGPASAAPSQISAAPSPVAPTPSSNAYPNAAEQALLADLRAVPGDFAAMCRRGPYEAVMRFEAGPGMPGWFDVYPTASLECLPGISSGAGDVIVRRIIEDKWGGSAAVYIETLLAEHSVRDPNGLVPGVGIPPGDCAASQTAEETWAVPGGGDSGQIVCYVDDQTGDALLVWTYDQEGIVVTARNERGDSAALYGFFERVARFIGG